MNRFEKPAGFSVKIPIFLSIFTLLASGCQSTKPDAVVAGASVGMSSQYVAPEPDNTPVDPKEATAIKVDKKNYSYFSSIDNAIVQDIQTGSPLSISRALNRMRKADIEYQENERVLFNIGARLMAVVWPNETQILNVPSVSLSNNYIATLEAAKAGIFEENSTSKDFFMTVLPAVALVSSTTKTDFYPMAEEALLSGLKTRPDSILCNYLMGLLCKKQHEYEKAVVYFDRATEHNAIVYEVLYEKADCLIQLGKYDAVSNILDKLMIQFPSDVKVLKLYAATALSMGDFARAEQYASLVLMQNPSDLEFVLFRAKIFVETGEYLKASSLLDVYAKTYPTGREYLLLRSRLQKEWNKNLSASVATIEKAMSLYPDDADVILYAAQLASETGHKIAGRTGGELAGQILSGDPQNLKALQYSVQSLYNESKYNEAYALSKRLMGVPSVPQQAVFMHIKVCVALRYNDEAWRYAQSLYEKHPDNIEIIQYYIEVMVATGRTQNASRLINNLLNQNTNAAMKSFLYYERSFIAPNETQALSDLRSSLISNPRNADALFRMYQIYYNRKDFRKAQYYLKQVVSLKPNDEKYLRLNAELDQLIK